MATGKSEILTSEMRESLKKVIQNEIEKLPELIESLDSKERIKVALRLIPFALPSVKSVHHREGEPIDFTMD